MYCIIYGRDLNVPVITMYYLPCLQYYTCYCAADMQFVFDYLKYVWNGELDKRKNTTLRSI